MADNSTISLQYRARRDKMSRGMDDCGQTDDGQLYYFTIHNTNLLVQFAEGKLGLETALPRKFRSYFYFSNRIYVFYTSETGGQIISVNVARSGIHFSPVRRLHGKRFHAAASLEQQGNRTFYYRLPYDSGSEPEPIELDYEAENGAVLTIHRKKLIIYERHRAATFFMSRTSTNTITIASNAELPSCVQLYVGVDSSPWIHVITAGGTVLRGNVETMQLMKVVGRFPGSIEVDYEFYSLLGVHDGQITVGRKRAADGKYSAYTAVMSSSQASTSGNLRIASMTSLVLPVATAAGSLTLLLLLVLWCFSRRRRKTSAQSQSATEAVVVSVGGSNFNHPTIVSSIGSMDVERMMEMQEVMASDKADEICSDSSDRGSSQFSSRFFKDFDIIEELGKGSFAKVFRVRDKHDKLDYAVKRIEQKDEKMAILITREIEAISNLLEDGIVRYYHTWIERPPVGTKFSVKMEKGGECTLKSEHPRALFIHIKTEVCNSSLDRWLLQHADSRDVNTVKNMFAQLVTAVAYIHSRGKMHRDLKPANILLDESDRLKICDFGISTELSVGGQSTFRTAEVGTPVYMAPEQFFGHYSAKVDIFSIGLILTEMSTLMAPADCMKVFTSFRAGVKVALPPSIPKELRQMIQRLTRVRSEDRPSAAEIAKTIERRWKAVSSQ